MDPKQVAEIIAELDKLLAENNTLAHNVAQANAALLQFKLGDRYAKFSRQIDQYDYEQALVTLRDCLRT